MATEKVLYDPDAQALLPRTFTDPAVVEKSTVTEVAVVISVGPAEVVTPSDM